MADAVPPSEQMAEYGFHLADYVVFTLLLGVSLAIGVYYAFKDRGKQSTEDYLMAGRSMPVFPVAVSIFASLLSAIAFVADPVEIYYYGIGYVFLVLGAFIGVVPVAILFVPHFHGMRLVSCFEYLEQKFNQRVRRFAAGIQVVTMFCLMALICYAPSLALAQASGIDVYSGIFLTTAVCTFYTVFGGMKAVVWADTVQMLIMILGVYTLAFKGVYDAGGFRTVIDKALVGYRLTYVKTTLDPCVRASMWTYLIGGIFRVLVACTSTQFTIQRFCTLNTTRQAQIALYLLIPCYAVLAVPFVLIGIVMYAIFGSCDPVMAGQIQASNQLMPLLIVRVLGDLPGVPGLFIASMFAASLSSLSSGQNALAANVLSDFIQPWVLRHYGSPLGDRKAFITCKVVAAVVGLLVMLVAFGVAVLGGSLFLLVNKILGMFAGPIGGLFVLAIFFPYVSINVTLTSFVISVLVGIWVMIGSLVYPMPPDTLPVSIDACPATNVTSALFNASLVQVPSKFESIMVTASHGVQSSTLAPITMLEESNVSGIYHLNSLLYLPLGWCITVFLPLLIYHVNRLCSGPKEDKSSDKLKINDNDDDEDDDDEEENNYDDSNNNLDDVAPSDDPRRSLVDAVDHTRKLKSSDDTSVVMRARDMSTSTARLPNRDSLNSLMYQWTRDTSNRLSLLMEWVSGRRDRGTQTSEPPSEHRNSVVWVLDKESVI